MTKRYTGVCFCGSVAVEAVGEPIEMGYCHCASCRAYSGAPLVAYALWKSGDVSITRGSDLKAAFNKTGMSNRVFCAKCGGHLMTEHPELQLTDIAAAALPGLAFRPSVHLNYSEKVLPVRDGLLKLKDFPAPIGSGEHVPE